MYGRNVPVGESYVSFPFPLANIPSPSPSPGPPLCLYHLVGGPGECGEGLVVRIFVEPILVSPTPLSVPPCRASFLFPLSYPRPGVKCYQMTGARHELQLNHITPGTRLPQTVFPQLTGSPLRLR